MLLKDEFAKHLTKFSHICVNYRKEKFNEIAKEICICYFYGIYDLY